jgi:hypothetical protein
MIKRKVATIATTLALPFVFSGVAGAQTLDVPGPSSSPSLQIPGFTGSPAFAFKSTTNRETWHTVLIVSGVLLFIGIVDSDSTLAILGGAGVLVSLSQTNGNAYRYNPAGRTLDFANIGKLSFGVNPFGGMNLAQGLNAPHPKFVVQAKFKF